jgi:AcrR family transcriptional regulator
VPKLWNQTIEAHRRDVRDAILDTTAALVSEHGLRQVTMSQIAEQTGIGRATLYKYFPDVESILVTWHHRHVTAHLEHLAAVRERATDPGQRLEAVLTAWAQIVYEIAHHQHGTELTALLHHEQHVADDQQQLHNLIRDVLADAAKAGSVRDDLSADDLASYCRHALNAARDLPSKAAVHRLVALTMVALRPASSPPQPTAFSTEGDLNKTIKG